VDRGATEAGVQDDARRVHDRDDAAARLGALALSEGGGSASLIEVSRETVGVESAFADRSPPAVENLTQRSHEALMGHPSTGFEDSLIAEELVNGR
jgi:hypothetical protein